MNSCYLYLLLLGLRYNDVQSFGLFELIRPFNTIEQWRTWRYYSVCDLKIWLPAIFISAELRTGYFLKYGIKENYFFKVARKRNNNKIKRKV